MYNINEKWREPNTDEIKNLCRPNHDKIGGNNNVSNFDFNKIKEKGNSIAKGISCLLSNYKNKENKLIIKVKKFDDEMGIDNKSKNNITHNETMQNINKLKKSTDDCNIKNNIDDSSFDNDYIQPII